MNLHTELPRDYANLLADMRLGQIRHHMARIEDNAQDFTLVNQRGDLINLFDQLDNGPLVLAFVNGNETIEDQNILCELGKLRPSLARHKAALMVIAPHSKALEAHRSQCEKIDADILHDVGNRIAFQYGLVHEPTDSINEYYEEFAQKDRRADPREAPLPVAAIYVIQPNRRIEFSYVKTGDTFRINTQDLLGILT